MMMGKISQESSQTDSLELAGWTATPPERLVRWGGVLGDTTSSCALGKEGEGGEAALPL